MKIATLAMVTAITSTAFSDWGPPHRLPDTVNKVGACDWGVSVSADGNTIYFASNRETNHRPDIYYSTRVGNGWSPATKLPGGINTPDLENSPCISWDGEYLFFERGILNTPEGNIWVAKREGAGWGQPVMIPGEVNTPDNWEYNPAISGDGRYLFFAAEDWPGNVSLVNIWRATWNGTAWVSPVNVTTVNTVYCEGDPAPTFDGQYLYFWSCRLPGQLAIFRARCLGGVTYGPAEPVPNLSDPDYDYCDPSLTQDGRYIFFSRADWGTNDYDIYYSEWSDPGVTASSLGRVKALFR